MREAGGGEHGEQIDERATESAEHPRGAVEALAHGGAEVVRGAATAEGDTSVDGALPVDDEVAQVVERLPFGQTDRVPDVVGQRLGRHHQGVDGHDSAPLTGQSRREPLRGADDDVGANRPVRRDHPSRLDRGDGRLLVHRRTAGLDGIGETAHQAGRMDDGAVRGVQRAELSSRSHTGRGLLFREQGEVLLSRAELARFGDLGSRPCQLWHRAGGADRATFGESAVDALRRDDGSDLVDRRPHRRLHRQRGGSTGRHCERCRGAGEQRRAPSTVSTRRTEAGDLRLEHDDAQVGLGPGEVVRGPQASEPGTNDGDVGVAVAGESGPRRPVVPSGFVPHREMPVGSVVDVQRTPQEYVSLRICK